MSRWMLLLFALLIGVGLAVQGGVNAQLRLFVGSPFRSALISVVVSSLALLPIVLFTWSNAVVTGQSAWWMWIGGLLGALFVVGSVILAPRLGAGTLAAALVTGQLLAAVVIDHFGWVGFSVVPVTWVRVVGVVLMFAGVLLIQRR
ncbi:MAG: hypothetical protein NVSMB42_25700 [Herpetosiphon sp.]